MGFSPSASGFSKTWFVFYFPLLLTLTLRCSKFYKKNCLPAQLMHGKLQASANLVS